MAPLPSTIYYYGCSKYTDTHLSCIDGAAAESEAAVWSYWLSSTSCGDIPCDGTVGMPPSASVNVPLTMGCPPITKHNPLDQPKDSTHLSYDRRRRTHRMQYHHALPPFSHTCIAPLQALSARRVSKHDHYMQHWTHGLTKVSVKSRAHKLTKYCYQNSFNIRLSSKCITKAPLK